MPVKHVDPNADIKPSTGNTIPVGSVAPVVMEEETKPVVSEQKGNDISPLSADKKDSESSTPIPSSSDEQNYATEVSTSVVSIYWL